MPGEKGDIIVFQLIKRRKGLTHQQFKDYWVNEHNKIEREIVNIGKRKKIVAHFVRGIVTGPGQIKETEDLPFDGILELHFDSIEDWRASLQPEVFARLAEDEKNFVSQEKDEEGIMNRQTFVLEEYLMAERAK